MTRLQQAVSHAGGGFIVVARIGHVACGGCGAIVPDRSTARYAHARSCAELEKLRAAAERAFQRAHPEAQWP